MNVSHAWLKDFVAHALTPDEIRDLLTSRVATVDAVEPLRADLAPFVVARVVECARHPDAEKLSVTRVDDGSGTLLDVVCGAPNVQAGKLYPFARVGTVMPGGLKIEKRKIRGAISNGMLCSARELGLGEDHHGILELTVDAAPGTPLLSVMPVGDTRIDVDISPNRPDLLSHLGIARELAAATGVALDPLGGRGPELTDEAAAALRAAAAEGPSAVAELLRGWEASGGVAQRVRAAAPAGPPPDGRRARAREATVDGVRVAIEDVAGCPRYLGAVIRGVKVGPSPAWLRERIEAVGGRSISNVVDVTNYMLHGFGQPMHAFDLTKLAGPSVIIRRARPGERLTTLDGVERTLTPSMTVIADAERAQALAGVMGGRASEVSDATTDIFLEVAAFSPKGVRGTRRALNLSTDASHRFERGTDVDSAEVWLMHAVHLLIEVAGGVQRTWHADAYPTPEDRKPLTLRADRVRRLLGEVVPAGDIAELLASVGFEVDVAAGTRMLHGQEELVVTAPTWRRDVVREVDLIEEVARLRGYDSFSSELRPFRPGRVPDAPGWAVARRVTDALVAAGLFEVRPMPFVAAGGDGAEPHVRVTNPLAEDEPYLRRDILETLAARAEYNLRQMQGNVRLFEVGTVFQPNSDRRPGSLPREEMRVGALLMGARRPPHFAGDAEPPSIDEWDAKGVAELAVAAVYPGECALRPPSGQDAGGRLWDIVKTADGGAAEIVGGVRRLALDAPVWAKPAFGIELRLWAVDSAPVAPPGSGVQLQTEVKRVGLADQTVRYRPIPTLPAAEIDLALIVPDRDRAGETLTAEIVEGVVRRASGELLERIVLFDEFRDEAKWPNARSLAWRLTFRHPERTLRDKEIDGRRDKVLKTLESELGVKPRI